MFQKNLENIKIHMLCSIFFSEHLAVCVITLEDMVERDRPRMTVPGVLISP
jgi:hypothetical protein